MFFKFYSFEFTFLFLIETLCNDYKYAYIHYTYMNVVFNLKKMLCLIVDNTDLLPVVSEKFPQKNDKLVNDFFFKIKFQMYNIF